MTKSQPRRRRKILPVLFLLLLILLLLTAFSESLRTVRYTAVTDKLTGPVRIALLTDLHSSYYGEKQADLLHAIQEAAPDLICLAGDIFDDKISHQGTMDLLDGIADRYPCYYVTGNHEHWSEEVHILNGLLVSYGVTVLAGDTAEVSVRDQTITISGIDDPTGFLAEGIPGTPDPDTWYGQLALTEEAVADSPYYAILLSHRPEKTEEYRSSPFDLVLSGHAHGGQIRIPFLLNGLFAPGQGYFPAYAGGEYLLDDTTLIVSRGLCINDLPRVFNRPELVVIDLVPQYNNSQKEDNP
ncbi:MAG: metallophosphoesterase [Ruminococcaceae bacterium]|nr:metallophosphoesterase [Oscillospiraceae bacterium]